MAPTERIAVFAYASLVDPLSAAATLDRPVSEIEPATVHGWRRRWSLVRDNLHSEKSFARLDDGSLPRWFLALNIEPGVEGEVVNGGLIELASADELARLDGRENRYDRVEVTGSVDAAVDDHVFAYTAKPEHTALEPPTGAVVMGTYIDAVERAFEALGQLELYLETTPPPPAERIAAKLVTDEIAPGNPREW